MNMVPVDLDPLFLSCAAKIFRGYMATEPSFGDIEVDVVKHWAHGNKILMIRFGFFGYKAQLNKPIRLQLNVAQIKKSGLIFSTEFIGFNFQENEVEPRVAEGSLYTPDLILLKKFRLLSEYEKASLILQQFHAGLFEALKVYETSVNKLFHGL